MELSEKENISLIDNIFKNLNIMESKRDIKKSMSEKKDYSGFYVFISFDIVNSTLYKSIDKDWYEVIDYFYENIPKVLKDSELGDRFQIWKYIGDEVLFYSKINNPVDLVNIPKEIIKTIKKTTQDIHKTYPDSRGLVNIKATAWSATISEKEGTPEGKSNSRGKNLLFKINRAANGQVPINMYDFIGPDIDLGFRLAKESAKKDQLVLSVELAYIILRTIDSDSGDPSIDDDKKVVEKAKYKIMYLKKLKGIWHERKYPVIWYREQWETDIFDYDENNIKKYDFYYNKSDIDLMKFLKEVLISVGRYEVIDGTIQGMKNASSAYLTSIVNAIQAEIVEVHLASVLFDYDGNFLLFERGKKNNNESLYDFGCVKLLHKKNFMDTMVDYYSGLLITEEKIEPLKDSFDNLIPIGTYTFKKSSGVLISGIVFCSRVRNLVLDKNALESDGYSGYLKIPYKDLNEKYLNDNNITLFDGSLENIKKASELFTFNQRPADIS